MASSRWWNWAIRCSTREEENKTPVNLHDRGRQRTHVPCESFVFHRWIGPNWDQLRNDPEHLLPLELPPYYSTIPDNCSRRSSAVQWMNAPPWCMHFDWWKWFVRFSTFLLVEWILNQHSTDYRWHLPTSKHVEPTSGAARDAARLPT